jgi:hypothetical protein
MTRIGKLLSEKTEAKVAELVLIVLVASATVALGWALVGARPLARQAVVWFANVLMLAMIWSGLRLRGQTWEHLGLRFQFPGWRTLLRMILQSIGVLIVALAAFVAGSAIVANVGQTPGPADMSGYSYLQGNLPMLLLALAAVYVVSSFGEEVVYRGFLMTRITELHSGARARWAWAVAVSALVFGLAHFDWGVMGMVQTAFMGLALAVSYLVVKRNLWVLVLAHVYIDSLLLIQLYLRPEAAVAG